MLFIHEIKDFLIAVIWNWFSAVGVLFGLLEMVERFLSKNYQNKIPNWLVKLNLRYLAIICIFIAIFLAWRQQYLSVQVLNNEKIELTTTLNEQNKEIQKLTTHLQELESLKSKENVYSTNQKNGITAGAISGSTININPDSTEQSEVERRKKQDIQKQLGKYVEEGKALRQKYLTDQPIDRLSSEKNQWEQRVENYLLKQLDQSYLIRFRNPDEKSIGVPIGIRTAVIGQWQDINNKTGMLVKFIGELNH